MAFHLTVVKPPKASAFNIKDIFVLRQKIWSSKPEVCHLFSY